MINGTFLVVDDLGFVLFKKYNVLSKVVFIEEKHGHKKLLKKYKIPESDYSIYNAKTKFDNYDWIIDGIFGIGLKRKLNGC